VFQVALFAPTPRAARRVLEFFTVQINNDHTREAHLNATRRFAEWCDARGIGQLADVHPFHVAAFVSPRSHRVGPPSTRYNQLMNSFPAQTQKIVPPDRSHIDFVRGCSDGSFRGIRVRHSTCILIETETGDIKPKTLHEVGAAHALASCSALSPVLAVEREILRGNYPELDEIINGTATLSEAFSPRP